MTEERCPQCGSDHPAKDRHSVGGTSVLTVRAALRPADRCPNPFHLHSPSPEEREQERVETGWKDREDGWLEATQMTRLVSCPKCAFTFDADHTDQDGGYSCPCCCAEARVEELKRDRDAALADSHGWRDDRDRALSRVTQLENRVKGLEQKVAVLRDGSAEWQEEASNLRHHIEQVIAAYDEFGPRLVRSEFERAIENARQSVTAPPLRPTPEEIESAKTPKGGWTRETLERWGVPWPPPKGWKKRLLEPCCDGSGQRFDGGPCDECPPSTGADAKRNGGE